MAEAKTKPTRASVNGFIAKVPNETRRRDARTLLKLFGKATGWKPQMWGPTIVGFGRYEYLYDTGRSGHMCVCGFSPRKASLVIYGGSTAAEKRSALLATLGEHETHGGCIYINTLADIDPSVLGKLIKAGVASVKAQWPVYPS